MKCDLLEGVYDEMNKLSDAHLEVVRYATAKLRKFTSSAFIPKIQLLTASTGKTVPTQSHTLPIIHRHFFPRSMWSDHSLMKLGQLPTGLPPFYLDFFIIIISFFDDLTYHGMMPIFGGIRIVRFVTCKRTQRLTQAGKP